MADPQVMENDFNPLIVAADTANMQAGASDSILSRAGAFAATAVVSGFGSIYNTAANLVGAEKFDVQHWLDENDSDFGSYYRKNKDLVDTVGFIGTSLVPGGLALKGLQLAKAGYMGGTFARAFGFASNQQQMWVAKGLQELAVEGGTVFDGIRKAKLAAMAWGVADNVIQVAAFETAVAATMKQSPLIEKDSWGDVGWHIVKTAGVFGAVGGGIEAIAVASVFKGATKTIDQALNKYRHLQEVQGDIPTGDKAYGILSSIIDIPTEAKNLEYTYKLAGKDNKLELPLTEAVARVRTATEQRGWEDFRKLSNDLAGGDAEVGQAFAGYVEKMVSSERANGASTENIKDRLRDHLLNVSKIDRVPVTAAEGFDDIFYLAEKIPPEKIGKINDFASLRGALASRAPTGVDAYSQPFRIVGDLGEVRIGIAGLNTETAEGTEGIARFGNVQDGFDAGVDAIVQANGAIKINPKSTRFIKLNDPVTTPRSYFNVRTGAFTDVAFPTVSDIATSAKPLAMTAVDHLVAGGRSWSFKPFDDFRIDKLDTIDASARYVYAAALKVVPNKISETDIPMLERIFKDGAEAHKDVIIRAADDTERKVDEIADFGSWMRSQKLQMLQARFGAGEEDLSSLAVKLNVEASWIERAVSNNFILNNELVEGSTIGLDSVGKVQNMELRWDFAKAKEAVGIDAKDKRYPKNIMIQNLPDGAGNLVGGVLGYQYRVQAARQVMEDAFTAVAGERAKRFIDIDPNVSAKLVDQYGAGPGLLNFSNADYGDTMRLWSQHTGQQTNLWIRDFGNGELDKLNPAMRAIQDKPEAAAELGVLVTALRRTPEKFRLDPTPGSKRLVNTEAVGKGEDGALMVDEGKIKALETAGRKAQFKLEHDETIDHINNWVAHLDGVNDQMKPLMASRGFNFNREAGLFVPPPVDTSRYPYFAFVRKKPEFIGASSEVSMITARSEQELRKLVDKVPSDYQTLFDRNTKEWHKAKGDYEYGLTLKDPTVDSTLQRSGVLGDFFPETRAENVLEDFVRSAQQRSSRFVRYAVETRYAQPIAEIRGIGKQFEEVGTSKFGGILKKFRSQVENPFEDYIKTALDISKRSEYTLLHDANEFAESLGASAYRFFDVNYKKAMERSISWEEANKVSQKFGLGAPYSDEAAYFRANSPADRNIIKEFVGKANMSLVNVTLRLDLANSLVNIISTPILLGTEMASIRSLVASDSQLAGKLAELRSIQLPDGTGARIPSTMKLLSGAIQNFFGDGKTELLARYENLGAVKKMLSQYHEMIEHLSYKPYKAASEFVEKGNKAIEVGAKLSANEFAEQLTRFVSADVMRQLTDPIVAAGKLSLAEQDAYISVFVNRVQGNYLASQRPIAFQGVLGSAVSLFQTYQFNLLQQLFRHVENRDTRALAVLGGLQSGIYGLNGVPFFEAINTHLIGNSDLNPSHKDAYSTLPQIVSKSLGDWMMYGTASAFPLLGSQSPALYTRGDINPRHISIIPISPMDVPAVDGSIRFVSNLIDTGKKLVQGADLSSTLLEGLEHNSISRPLAGIAQVFSGYSTTSKGSLISASNDFSLIATMSRVSGAKPMDEALALNSLFRLNAYQAADAAKLQQLGEVVKTKLRSGKSPTPDELHTFQLEYAKSGGRIENYSRTLQRWSRDANSSTVNQLLNNHRSSYSKRMTEIMGGTTLPDFRSKIPPSMQSTPVEVDEQSPQEPQQ